MELENIKNKIESLDKIHQIEILKIIKKFPTTINENKSGVYINLSFLSPIVINEMIEYLKYINDQEHFLTPFESQKNDIKNTFFRKEDKDILSYNNN